MTLTSADAWMAAFRLGQRRRQRLGGARRSVGAGGPGRPDRTGFYDQHGRPLVMRWAARESVAMGGGEDDVVTARGAVLRHFRWLDGHADIWRVFADARALRAVVDGLVAPWREAGVTVVVGVESRGFLLGAVCAAELGAGFVAIRKDDGLLPGPKVTTQADQVNYRGHRPTLRMQRLLTGGDRVLMIDDWVESGSQVRGAAKLVLACGAAFLGASVIVDQLSDVARPAGYRMTSVVSARELGDAATGGDELL